MSARRTHDARRLGLVLAMTLGLAACGRGETEGSAAAPPGETSVAPGANGTTPATPGPTGSKAAGGTATLADRAGELVNPSETQMILLYHALTGIPAPLEKWTEDDGRVKYAAPQERAARRAEVRAEFEAAARSVAEVGRLRMTLNVNGLPYDPTYEEFRVGAFAPSAVYGYRALGETVSVRIGNGQAAQIWRVPRGESQAVLDRAGPYPNLQADALLRIVDVQPEGAGGVIVADVVDYELRARNGQTLVGRVKLAP